MFPKNNVTRLLSLVFGTSQFYKSPLKSLAIPHITKNFALGLAKIFVDVRNSEIYAGFCKIFLKYQRHTGLLVRFLGNIEPQKYNGTFVHK